jgi:hypothetical protein
VNTHPFLKPGAAALVAWQSVWGKAHCIAFLRHGVSLFHKDGIVGLWRDTEVNRYSHV